MVRFVERPDLVPPGGYPAYTCPVVPARVGSRTDEDSCRPGELPANRLARRRIGWKLFKEGRRSIGVEVSMAVVHPIVVSKVNGPARHLLGWTRMHLRILRLLLTSSEEVG